MKKYLTNPIGEYNLFLRRKSSKPLKIIGILQDMIIYTGEDAIKLFQADDFDDVVSDQRAKLMACLDLGHQWDNLAKCPVCITLEWKDE